MRILRIAKLFLGGILPPRLFSKLHLLVMGLLNIRTRIDLESRKFFFRHLFLASRIYPGIVYPRVLAIFTTTRCNLRCFVCDRESFKGEDLIFDNIHKLEKPIKYAKVIDLTGWGEFFVYPKWREILRYIYSINPGRNLIQITSNGTLLSREIALTLSGHLKALTLSLNAATQETYNRDMRYGDFNRTIDHIRDFMASLEEEDRPKVRLHFVAHTQNYKEIPEFVRLAHRLSIQNVSIGNYYINRIEHIHYALFNIKDDYNNTVLRAEEISKELCVTFSAPRFHVKQHISSQLCSDPFNVCFILPSGEVAGPCCYSGDYPMGNVYEASFKAVWFGEKYQKLREVRYLPACKTCSPFLILDDPAAHLTGHFKQREGSHAIVKNLRDQYQYSSSPESVARAG